MSIVFDDLTEEINKAGRSVARQWPTVIEPDDVVQELWTHLLARRGYLESLLEMPNNNRYSALVAIGHQIANKYRLDKDIFSGQFHYSADEIKSIMDAGAISVNRSFFAAELADIDVALAELRKRNKNQYDILLVRYQLHESVGPSRKSLLSNAVTALTTLANLSFQKRSEAAQGPGSRRVISNATAQAIASKQTGG